MKNQVSKAYESQPINNTLRNFTPKDLRHAANYMDRERGKFAPINALSLSRKLDALKATMIYSGNECGHIEFFLDEKNHIVTRHFYSVTELTTAINLGPVDLYWHGNLFIKLASGTHKVEIKKMSKEDHKLVVWVPEVKIFRDVFIAGAEKILCNSAEGLTAGQMKLLVGGAHA